MSLYIARMSSLFCPLSLSAGRFAPTHKPPHHHHSARSTPPFTTHTLLSRHYPPPHLPPLRGTSYQKSLGALYSFSTVLNVAMLFSRAACCALSHTHIAPRKIVLTAHFFSLVLMLQDARLLFCSTPSHITPHPSPGSFPTAIYTSPIISFSAILDVYMFTGALRRSFHPLYMPHGGICPQITPTLANLPPSIFTRCHGSVPF